jgi:hypothetical protein
VNGLTRERRPTRSGRPVESVRVSSVVLRSRGVNVECHGVQEPLVEQVEHAIFGLAESFASLDHLVEDRLQPGRAGHCMQYAADRPLLLECVLEPASELGLMCNPAHARSLEPKSHLMERDLVATSCD